MVATSIFKTIVDSVMRKIFECFQRESEFLLFSRTKASLLYHLLHDVKTSSKKTLHFKPSPTGLFHGFLFFFLQSYNSLKHRQFFIECANIFARLCTYRVSYAIGTNCTYYIFSSELDFHFSSNKRELFHSLLILINESNATDDRYFRIIKRGWTSPRENFVRTR